jgi:soluble lytic murein transglycosylase-like protein
MVKRRTPQEAWCQIVAACLILLLAPACAHGGGRAAKPANAAPKGASVGGGAALADVLRGISGFEARAKAYTPDEWNYVLGYAHFMNGRWEEAGRAFEKASGKLPVLADHLLFYRAATANRLGHYETALGFLDELRASFGDSIFAKRAQVERAVALAGLKRFDEAERILSSAESAASEEDRPDIEALSVRMLVDAGECSRAAGKLQSIALASQGERDIAALAGLMDEVKSRCRVDVRAWIEEPGQQLRLVQSFTAHSEWADAAARLEKLLKGASLDEGERAHAKWLLARCYRWTHRYDEAIRLMEELRQSSASAGFSDDLLATLATTYMKKNDYAKALAIRQSMLDRLPPRSAAAASIASKIAFLHMDEGKYAEAIPLWEHAAGMAGGKVALTARWYRAWCFHMLGDHAAAVEAFDALSRRGAKAGGIDDRVAYWKAQSLVALKQTNEAHAILRGIEEAHPGGYYAMLAHKALAGERGTVAEFLAVDTAWPKGAAWKPGELSAGGSPHLARAIELDKLGLHEEAARELRAAGGGDEGTVLWLASRNYAHDVGYAIARGRHAQIFKGGSGQGAYERFLWEQAYPRAYEPAMLFLAKQEGVDPALAWSIMQNESVFKPHALSPAGAVGLMQLMPTTAGVVAKERGAAMPARRDLLNPLTNISFGMAYLGKLAKLFPGNEVAQIAAYNAGEEAAARWLKNGSYDHIEEWIEEIPYDETNLYVKKVLTSYWKYEKLYGKAE